MNGKDHHLRNMGIESDITPANRALFYRKISAGNLDMADF